MSADARDWERAHALLNTPMPDTLRRYLEREIADALATQRREGEIAGAKKMQEAAAAAFSHLNPYERIRALSPEQVAGGGE